MFVPYVFHYYSSDCDQTFMNSCYSRNTPIARKIWFWFEWNIRTILQSIISPCLQQKRRFICWGTSPLRVFFYVLTKVYTAEKAFLLQMYFSITRLSLVLTNVPTTEAILLQMHFSAKWLFISFNKCVYSRKRESKTISFFFQWHCITWRVQLVHNQ